jgi:hypothetical protein
MLSHMADRRDWIFRRSVARVEATIEGIVADFATSYVGRPVQRHDIAPPRPLPGIMWSIDGELVVEFVHRESGPDQLVVHELALLDLIRRRFRTRHVHVAYATTTWDSDAPSHATRSTGTSPNAARVSRA